MKVQVTAYFSVIQASSFLLYVMGHGVTLSSCLSRYNRFILPGLTNIHSSSVDEVKPVVDVMEGRIVTEHSEKEACVSLSAMRQLI